MSKIIVITGGSDGLGKTLTEALSKDNKVIILATNEEKLKQVSVDNNCEYYVCDVSDYYQVEKTINDILNKYGSVDVLINNAGLCIQGELELNDPIKIKSVIEVNLLGVINCTKAVIPCMKKQEDGIIINVNSQGGKTYKAERSIYNASKWGLTGFTKCIQPELIKYGIRVIDLMPGRLITNMLMKIGLDKGSKNRLETKEVARVVRFLIDTPKDVIIPEIEVQSV